MSKGFLIGLVAETPIHVGIGQAAEAIDLPVAREVTTGLPHVPGSGVKGALRVWALETARLTEEDVGQLFGAGVEDDGTERAAGQLLCGEARLALLPVRCTSQSYKLVTCPLILQRLARDRARMGLPANKPSIRVDDGTYLGAEPSDGATLGLEEREFDWKGDLPPDVLSLLTPLTKDTFDDAYLKDRVVLVSNKDFKWFAEFALPVAMRNRLNENKIVVGGALWAEESLAADTVLWMLLSQREVNKEKIVEARLMAQKIVADPYIQMGGNETVGQGWFKMTVAGGEL